MRATSRLWVGLCFCIKIMQPFRVMNCVINTNLFKEKKIESNFSICGENETFKARLCRKGGLKKMKKTLSLICGCALTLTMVACSVTPEEAPTLEVTLQEETRSGVPESAPSLEVTFARQSVKAIQGTTSWSGNKASYESDSMHPLQIPPEWYDDVTIVLENGSGELKLHFSDNYPPQELQGVRWLAEYATGNQDIQDVFGKSEQIEIIEDTIIVVDDDNDYIYEISARWTNNNGSRSSYAFRTFANLE